MKTNNKPCPFCGKRAVYDHFGAQVCIVCTNCRATTNYQSCKDEAKMIWNRRVEPSAPQWTTKTPTEEGMYVVDYRHRNENKLMMAKVFKKECLLLIYHHFPQSSMPIFMSEFLECYKPIYWFKIELPPTPEESKE
jgi:hypothetical protein